jgi:hypothetical protein
MPQNSGYDLWNLAFSNVGRRGGQRRNDNGVAQAIQAISGIPATPHRSKNVTGEVTIHDLGEQVSTHGNRRPLTATGCSAHVFWRNDRKRTSTYISAVSLSPPISWDTWSACTASSWGSPDMESRRTALRDIGGDGCNASWSAPFSWIRTISA